MPGSTHYSPSGFIRVEVRADALAEALRAQSLHITDLHCLDATQKQILQTLLLSAVANSHAR